MQESGFGDFDFLIGEWTIRNEVLKGRLVGSTEWSFSTPPPGWRK